MNATLEIQITCDGQVETASFTDFPIRIGRDPRSDLHLPHSFISRHHARIERTETGFAIVDEGGRNGVRIGGVKLPRSGRAEIVDRTEIAIERLVMTVRIDESTRPMSFDHATAVYPEPQVVPDVMARVGVAIEEMRATRAMALAIVGSAMNAAPRMERDAVGARLVALYPELGRDPEFACFVGEGRDDGARTEPLVRDDDELRSRETVARLESDFAELARRHACVVAHVDAEVVTLLDHLSPAAIDRDDASPRWLGVFRSPMLWHAYERRHQAATARLRDRFARARAALEPRQPAPALSAPRAEPQTAREHPTPAAIAAPWSFVRVSAGQ